MTPLDKRQRPLPIHWYGAHVGARLAQPAVVRFASRTRAALPEITYFDALPGRAEEMALLARRSGVQATAVEADVRALAPATPPTILIIQLDDARAAAEVLARNTDVDVLAAILVRFTDERVAVVTVDAKGGDVEERRGGVLLLSALAVNAAEGGSSFLGGADARTAQRVTSVLLRNVINTTFTTRLEKRFAHLSVPSGVAMSTDGRSVHRVIVRDARRDGFGNPAALAYDEITSPRSAIRPGETIVVAEVGPEAEIRLHRVGRRVTDAGVTVNGVTVMDPRKLTPLDGPQWVRAESERRRLVGDAERIAVTRAQGVYVSD